MTRQAIPSIDIAPLFGGPSPARHEADRALAAAAGEQGFLSASGLPEGILDPVRRRRLLSIFSMDPAEQRRLWRHRFDPAQPNVYRGWSPPEPALNNFINGIDLGCDVAHGPRVVDPDDPLMEATPLPPEAAAPGFREAAAGYYRDMERTGRAIMRSLARGMGLAETVFDEPFEGGNSTLRLLRYPERPFLSEGDAPDGELWVEHAGVRRHALVQPHCDSGLLTLLAQDGTSGLMAEARDGTWLDVPCAEGTLAINFGRLLERWTAGRIRATTHRVLGQPRERFSLPFFYEPRVDAEIAPLPLPEAEPFAPFLYGDHLWALSTRFPQLKGLEHLRKPRRPSAA